MAQIAEVLADEALHFAGDDSIHDLTPVIGSPIKVVARILSVTDRGGDWYDSLVFVIAKRDGHVNDERCQREKHSRHCTRSSTMRWAIALAFAAFACTTTTSVTKTGKGLFAPREDSADEAEAPRGMSLSVGSIASDGTVTLDLRNYSLEPFVFSGTPKRPRLIVEVQSGNTHSRHTISPWPGKQTHEVPAGERIQLTTNIDGASGRVRIGIPSYEFGYVLWTEWIAR